MEYVLYLTNHFQRNGGIFLRLWYLRDELQQSRVERFITTWESALATIGSNIHVGSEEQYPNRSWFDIRPKSLGNNIPYRHYFVYRTPEEIINGLIAFKSTVEAELVRVQRPEKPQPPPDKILREGEVPNSKPWNQRKFPTLIKRVIHVQKPNDSKTNE